MGKGVVVFCGAKGPNPDDLLLATRVGNAIRQTNHYLIFGGGNVGMMKAVHDGYMERTPEVASLASTTYELGRLEGTCHGAHTVFNETMAGRKELYRLADVVLVLPGGVGTLDELFEFLTYRMLGSWDGLIAVVGTGPITLAILSLFELMVKEGYIDNDCEGIAHFKTDIELHQYLSNPTRRL